jgi:hypothetical protein
MLFESAVQTVDAEAAGLCWKKKLEPASAALLHLAGGDGGHSSAAAGIQLHHIEYLNNDLLSSTGFRDSTCPTARSS